MTVVAVQRERGLALCAGESGRSSVPDGVAPMALHFNGTVYYRGEDGALQMVSDHLDTLIESLLWEGYALYPYIPSATKNATPTPFGIAHPPAYAQALDTTYDHLELRIALAAPSDAVLHAEVHLLAPVGARHQAPAEHLTLPGAMVGALAQLPGRKHASLRGEVGLDRRRRRGRGHRRALSRRRRGGAPAGGERMSTASAVLASTVYIDGANRPFGELTMVMQRDGVETVAELDPAAVMELAPKLWIVPPGGTLL
jgi:hypothetical protein